MPTLEEIAALSGVSRSTVSRVINNDPHVSEETRKKVLAVVDAQGYRPNLAARGLAAGRTGILGFFVPASISRLFSDPYFSALLEGISGACNRQNCGLMFWLDEQENESRKIGYFIDNGLIDGVIVSSFVQDDPLLSRLKSHDLPVVLIGRSPKDLSLPYVDVDNRGSAYRIVEHLVELGHRRIATIAGPQSTMVGRDRLAGYRDALHALDSRESTLMVEASFDEQSGYEAMQTLLPQLPNAVFAASDIMARGALRAIREANLRVPADVALVGFDDLPFAAYIQPPLTTIHQPIRALGEAAVQLLIEHLNNPEEARASVILPTHLVVRNSCGASSAPDAPEKSD
jgi:LacI family transcriptional regulator